MCKCNGESVDYAKPQEELSFIHKPKGRGVMCQINTWVLELTLECFL